MPALDIFSGDAFSVTSLTESINKVPHVPGRIGKLGYFAEKPITTTAMFLETKDTSVSLVASAARGAPAPVKVGGKRSVIPISTVHLPQRATIGADEVQGIRAFGSETETETVQAVVNDKLEIMRRDLDATIEYQRIGAIKGQVLDSDGTSVLLDLFTTLGVAQQTKSLVLGTAGTKVRNKVTEALRLQDAEMGNLIASGSRVLCSAQFFDALVGHSAVEAAYDRWMNGQFLRDDVRGGFYYAGVYWEEYRGKVGAIDFIAAGDAYMVPEGVPGLFVTNFAPADYMETVNTRGLPYYAKQELMDFNKGVALESQSNPISICTRPRAIIKLTA